MNIKNLEKIKKEWGQYEEKKVAEEAARKPKAEVTRAAGDGEFGGDGLYCVEQPGTRLKGKARNSGQVFENLTWLTSNEAAEYLRLPSVGALRVLVFQRRIPFHKLGRSLRFKKGELDRHLDASRNGGI